MGKIQLVVADNDKDYLEGIVEYIMYSYSHRFNIWAFSDVEELARYFTENTADILLVSSQMDIRDVSISNIKVPIISKSEKTGNGNEIFPSLMKYQHGEKLVNEILNIYAESNTPGKFVCPGSKNSTVIGVYSGMGGAGKTTFAIALSSILSKNLVPVFYLNLENIASTHAYFKDQSGESISNLFYYLREGSKNLQLKLEAKRCTDVSSGVFYFARPDSVMDMEEIKPEEYCLLIRQLREISLYNYIIVDLSSGMDQKTIKILEECDEIFYIHIDHAVSQEKKKQLEKAFEEISLRQHINLSEKTTLVLNRCSKTGMEGLLQSDFLAKSPEIKIKFEPRYNHMKPSQVISELEREVGALAQRLMKQKNCEAQI